ncbi:PTS system sorbose subfamily IIB component [Desulfovibrio sp. X2]|uniref:PTS sugar transporter subunit IIB n=1 Tax=Desulfovibrio sp. X2 TaxID=941449 RepID=UPI000358D756|nr:PTS sugar transporter subunit IIB [Desulfovibrio sp. X2]EPR42204.1 PTS system sorbose subfamily IIB component [Desulfovibrio sp. X2]
MFWVRIDNRLVHGQIIEAWLPFTGAETLVVANDELAEDGLRQEIMALAIPEDISLHFARVQALPDLVASLSGSSSAPDVMVLFATCIDARRAYEAGLHFSSINIGNLHYSPGKKQICAHVAVSSEDESCLGFFSAEHVALDYRCVPNDPVQVKKRW